MEQVHEAVGEIPVRYVMGGLARDSGEPMSEEVRTYIQDQWSKVTAQTGAEFNWSFWERCRPRRSTYPACRAVIAAARQGQLREMFEAIQRAYYREARNPSDVSTLEAVAGEIGLDRDRFAADIASGEVERDLLDGFNVRRSIGANQFPSLVIRSEEEELIWLTKGYADGPTVLGLLSDARLSSQC